MTVAELRCAEPGCPPVETVVAVLGAPGGSPRQWKIHKPMSEVTRGDVERLADPGGGAGVVGTREEGA